MLALLGVVVSVGFLDSLNPSTVGPALYLVSHRDGGRSVIEFAAGVFAVSAISGVVLVLGPARLLVDLHPRPHSEHLVELAAGLTLLVVALALWLARARIASHVAENERTIQRSSVLVGAGIMAVELPTALPYFAVIAAIAGSRRAAATQVALVLLFNLMFVAPLFALLAVRRMIGPPGVAWLEIRRAQLERHAGEAAAALVLVIAIVLIAVGMSGLAGS